MSKQPAGFPREHTSATTAPMAPQGPGSTAPPTVPAAAPVAVKAPAAPPMAKVKGRGGAKIGGGVGKPKTRPVSSRVREMNGM